MPYLTTTTHRIPAGTEVTIVNRDHSPVMIVEMLAGYRFSVREDKLSEDMPGIVIQQSKEQKVTGKKSITQPKKPDQLNLF